MEFSIQRAGRDQRADPVVRRSCIATASPSPAPRSDFLAFYSSMAGGVFMLGGYDPSNTALHDMWYRAIADDWRPVPAFAYTLGTPLAATFAYGDRRLYVLDRISRDESTVAGGDKKPCVRRRRAACPDRCYDRRSRSPWDLEAQHAVRRVLLDGRHRRRRLAHPVDSGFSRIAKLGD